MLRLPGHLYRLAAALDGWPRRIAAAACLLGALFSALGPGGHTDPGTLVPVLVASRALTAGSLLTSADLAVLHWPAASVPVASPTSPAQVVGRRVAADLARGQPLAAGNLLEPTIAAALAAGRVTTTVSLADPNQATILQAGSHIDLYTQVADNVLIDGKTVSESASVAKNVTVLAVLPAPGQLDKPTGRGGGPGLIIATDRLTVARLAQHLSVPFLATLVAPP